SGALGPCAGPRVDWLADAFLELIGRYLPIDPEAAQRIRATIANVGSYDRRGGAASWFTRDEMAAFYALCPRWRCAERQEYGDLLHEAIDWSAPEPARGGGA